MPIKISWSKGKSLGQALFYFGLNGLAQMIYIAIGQYSFEIGSLYIVALVPLGALLATWYAHLLLTETEIYYEEAAGRRNVGRSATATKGQRAFDALKNFLIVQGIFAIAFIFGYVIFAEWLDAKTAFMIGENLGAIAVLVVAGLQSEKIQ
jgi:hypothetical protein